MPGRSLFRQRISPTRTCEQAAVPPRLCACKPAKRINLHTSQSRRDTARLVVCVERWLADRVAATPADVQHCLPWLGSQSTFNVRCRVALGREATRPLVTQRPAPTRAAAGGGGDTGRRHLVLPPRHVAARGAADPLRRVLGPEGSRRRLQARAAQVRPTHQLRRRRDLRHCAGDARVLPLQGPGEPPGPRAAAGPRHCGGGPRRCGPTRGERRPGCVGAGRPPRSGSGGSRGRAGCTFDGQRRRVRCRPRQCVGPAGVLRAARHRGRRDLHLPRRSP